MAKKYTRLEWERIMNSLPPEDREPYEQSPDVDTQTPEGDTPAGNEPKGDTPTTDKYETDEQGVLTKNNVPFTGEYLGKTYKDGKVVETPKGETPEGETESIREKLGIGEALLNSKWAGKAGEGQLFDVFDLWKQKKYTAAKDLFFKTNFGKLSKTAQGRELGKLENSDEYKNGLSTFLDKMRSVLLSNNLPVDNKVLEDYYLRGVGEDVIVSEVYNKATTGGGGAFGSPNEKNLKLLQQAAKKNNIDLATEFGDEVDTWLKNIFNGQSIDVFYQRIRDKAAEKLDNNYVKGLLSDGQNLRDIYDRYITLMAQKFKIAKETIDLNDPLLSQVFKSGTGMNLTEFENLVNNDSRFKTGLGEFSVKSTRQAIVDYALAEGFQLDDDAVEDLLNNILAMGLPADSPYVKSLIRAKFTYSPGVKLGGVSGNRLASLRATAARNGLDLDTQFGSQVETWLKRLSQGEDIETFNRIIRQTAALPYGTSAPNVASLMNLGVDLEAILQPYKDTMASELGINPTTILNNDALLTKAFGEKGEMSLGDYRRLVRQDPRFQYTPKAYEETYNAGLKILQDFGFQG